MLISILSLEMMEVPADHWLPKEQTSMDSFSISTFIRHWFLHSLLSWLSHIAPPILLFALLISQLVLVYIVDCLLNLHHC